MSKEMDMELDFDKLEQVSGGGLLQDLINRIVNSGKAPEYKEILQTQGKAAAAVLAHNEKCVDCAYRRLCLGGCRATGLQCYPGDILAPDESTCRLFRDG